jgi:hypothetical protein
MSSSNTTEASGGIGVLGLLGVVFVTLKLCGVINWPWVWVTAPFWGPVALVCALLVAFAVFMFGFWLFANMYKSKP